MLPYKLLYATSPGQRPRRVADLAANFVVEFRSAKPLPVRHSKSEASLHKEACIGFCSDSRI